MGRVSRVTMLLTMGLAGCASVSPSPAPVRISATLVATPTPSPAPPRSTPPSVLSVLITPATASIPWPTGPSAATVALQAAVAMSDGSGNAQVVWTSASPSQLVVAASGGAASVTLGPSPVPGVYVVTAQALANPAIGATATITVPPGSLVGGLGSS